MQSIFKLLDRFKQSETSVAVAERNLELIKFLELFEQFERLKCKLEESEHSARKCNFTSLKRYESELENEFVHIVHNNREFSKCLDHLEYGIEFFELAISIGCE